MGVLGAYYYCVSIYSGVMCNRCPTYCGFNLCCCASNRCYNELRNHFLQGSPQPKHGIKIILFF